jgi:hypothetical protein
MKANPDLQFPTEKYNTIDHHVIHRNISKEKKEESSRKSSTRYT